MAACGFGASGLKITNLCSGSLRPKLTTTLQPFNAFTTRKYNTLSPLSNTSSKLIIRCLSQADLAAAADLEGDSEGTDSSEARSSIIPNPFEVESLLTTLCDTSIAEFELKLHGFQLYVSRDLVAQAAPSPPPAPAPASVTTPTVIKTPVSNGSALALSRPVPSSDAVQALLDKAADEGLVILQSPKVGFFRRSRTIKGKKAPPSCKEKDTVKEGQVLCYIEQLGGEIPIESDTVGEVVKILRKDGDAIGYGDALMAILPSFPGIKKLQ